MDWNIKRDYEMLQQVNTEHQERLLEVTTGKYTNKPEPQGGL